MSKEEIISIIKGYEHDRYFGANQNVLPENEYEYVANDIVKLADQNTNPLIDEIANTKKVMQTHIDEQDKLIKELTDEIAKLKASKSEASVVELEKIKIQFANYWGLEESSNSKKAFWQRVFDFFIPYIQSKSEANEWISVLLALPNDGIEVNVRLDCAYNGNGIIEPKSSAKFNHSTKYWESGLSTLYSVTHWKPLT